MKRIFLFILIIGILAAASIVIAKGGLSRNPATVVPSGKTVVVPDQAIDNSPVLERAIFIHYKKGFGKPGTECGNNVCEESENPKKCPQDCKGAGDQEPKQKCYGFLAKGAKLKSVENLTIHPDLNASAILSSSSEWDLNTSTDLFSSYTIDVTADWDNQSPDGRNEFSFGNYPNSGVIAVTVVWGYFSGPPQIREIIEFDVLFDTDYVWGDADVNPLVMDLENIAIHEIGHGLGLDDIYENSCAQVTMYGYSDTGETKKRTLELSDIAGLQQLYGL